MPNDPAFPVVEITRHIVSPGLSAIEVYTLALLAAQVAHSGIANITFAEIASAKDVAEKALAHRVQE